jgi:LuxR family transcriptional regulator, maltose regulon positive regulatory protein
VEPTVRSEAAEVPPAPAVRGGIVSRRQLFRRLEEAERVTQVSAPAGSGKTCLLHSWTAAAGLADSTAWVAVQGQERDPQQFWLAVTGALQGTAAGAKLVRKLSAAPDLDGWVIVERLLEDLATLGDRLWLVIDDLHELRSEALAQLRLLVMRAPPQLRFVLSARQDLPLGLHRLRLEGELTEIRAEDLKFTLTEARALLEAAGVDLPASTLAVLHERTEGWAAGLRLAALSLAGHPDPERFAADFSGSERTVAEYLLAEVLERQPGPARRLLLRTSVLERVNGELASLLTGESGGDRILLELEEADAFVMALDAHKRWFRYHHLFADLLQLELRRTTPGEIPALHATAAGWFAGHGCPIEAVRHAQAVRDWELAARVLAGHWFSLYLDGQVATARELLTGFPPDVVAADAELTALTAASEMYRGSLEETGRYLAAATGGLASVPAGRRGRLQVMLAILRLVLARRRGDLAAVGEEAERLLAPAGSPGTAPLGLSADLRALALIDIGMVEVWTARLDEAEHHLEQGIALAHRIGRPYLEVMGLASLAAGTSVRSVALAAERSRQAIELARRHGWSEEPITGTACAALGATMVAQGRLAGAEPWLEHAERTLTAEVRPGAGLGLYYMRGLLELARGHPDRALAAFRAAERLTGLLVTPHMFAPQVRADLLQALVRLGETARAEQAMAGMGPRERDTGDVHVTLAVLRLAQHDPLAAATALTPVLDGSAPITPDNGVWAVRAFLLEAIARDALGDHVAAGRALEHALDLAEPDGLLLPFLLHPATGLLRRHSRHRTAHAALTARILNLLSAPANPSPPPARTQRLREPLTSSEARVLRYLPTSLTVPELADELYLSVNTVRTHMRHIYAKLGVHHRHEAVEQGRALGLIASSPHGPLGQKPPPAMRRSR